MHIANKWNLPQIQVDIETDYCYPPTYLNNEPLASLDQPSEKYSSKIHPPVSFQVQIRILDFAAPWYPAEDRL